MKSRFRAAMSSKKQPWLNLTKKLEQEAFGDGAEFQYSVLEYLTNLVMFSIDPSSVRILYSTYIQYVPLMIILKENVNFTPQFLIKKRIL